MFPLKELGYLLRKAREEKNISLDELQKITKIQKRYLVELEEGNYSALPGTFYVRAFVKQYAETVGLDAEELMKQHEEEIGSPPKAQVEAVEQVGQRKVSRASIFGRSSKRGEKVFSFVPTVLAIICIVGIAVAMWFYLQGKKDNPSPAEVQENAGATIEKSGEKPPTKIEPKKNTNIKTTPIETTPEPPKTMQSVTVLETTKNTSKIELANTTTFSLEITSVGNSWVGVKNAKNYSFLGRELKAGETEKIDLTNETEVLLKVGNATNISLKINDQPFSYPIDPTKEVFQKITIMYKK